MIKDFERPLEKADSSYPGLIGLIAMWVQSKNVEEQIGIVILMTFSMVCLQVTGRL